MWKRHDYISAFGIFALIILLFLDGVSLVGLHTSWIDRLLQKSLVMDKKKGKPRSFSGLQRLMFSTVQRFYEIAMHGIGYAIVLITIIFGYLQDRKQLEKKEQGGEI